MQLSGEFILSLIASALTGAAMAWLGNRVMNAELWGHVRQHCKEIARGERELLGLRRFVEDGAREIERRIEYYSGRIRELESFRDEQRGEQRARDEDLADWKRKNRRRNGERNGNEDD